MGRKLKENNNSPIGVIEEESGIFLGHAQIHNCGKTTENRQIYFTGDLKDSEKCTTDLDQIDNKEKETKAHLMKLQSVDDDFLQTLLFPHLETTLKDEIMGTKPRGRTYELLKRSRSITKYFAEYLYPSRTRNNMKIFGGKKAVELERERAKHSGYIIHPCSKFRQYWDLIIMVMLCLNMFILPLDIAFFNSKTWVGFHVTSDCLCMLDIVFNFRTGYRISPKMKAFELDQGKIARQYLKSWFTLDLISSLPLHYLILLICGEPENVYLGLKGASRALKFLKVVKLLNLLKLLRLSRIIRGIAQYEDVYCITTSLMRYIKLVSMMMMVAHWNGCFHFLVPLLQDFPNECWVKLSNIENEQWFIQYGWALFKTLSHMLSIGYGRYTPILLSEAIITIFSMVTGATFYALFIAHSMAFIIQHDLSKTCYQEKVKQIEEYMIYRNLPDRIKKRVTVYFNQKFCQGRFFNEDDVLSGLSRPLRNDIVRYTCQDIVEKIPFLKKASPEFVSSILSKITSDVYLAGDVILKEGSCLNEMYFVKTGSLELTVNDTIVETLCDGSYFGEISALTGKRSMYSVTAQTACDVFILSGHDTKFILGEYEEMRPLIEHEAIERILQIYKECDLASLDERRTLTSCNSPEENDINFSLILLHETIKENLDSLLTSAIDMKSQESKDAIVNNMTDTGEVKRLFLKLLEEHRSLHSVCELYNSTPVVGEVVSQIGDENIFTA